MVERLVIVVAACGALLRARLPPVASEPVIAAPEILRAWLPAARAARNRSPGQPEQVVGDKIGHAARPSDWTFRG